MSRQHDLGGRPAGPVERVEAPSGWLRREKEKDIEAARGLPEHRAHGGHKHEHHHGERAPHHGGTGRDPTPADQPVIDEYEIISEAMIQGLVARGLLRPGELRAVREPRQVLSEFGLDIADEVKVRVHDSTANMHYLVLPMHPLGTEDWTEDRLKRLITRDSMIGVAHARDPQELGMPG